MLLTQEERRRLTRILRGIEASCEDLRERINHGRDAGESTAVAELLSDIEDDLTRARKLATKDPEL